MTASYNLDQAVVSVVSSATGKQVGLAAVPAEYPQTPYAIVDPSSKSVPTGDMASLVSNRDYKYVIRCYGEDPRQVRWMEDKIESAMISSASTFGAQWVLPESSGAIVPDGSELYSSVSTFCVRM